MPDAPVPVDGVAPPAPEAAAAAPAAVPSVPKAPPSPQVRKWKIIFLVVLGSFYFLYVIWCFGLMAVLPDSTGNLDWLLPVGLVSIVVSSLLLLGAGVIAGARAGTRPSTVQMSRFLGIAKVVGVVLPGLLLSGLAAYTIIQPPVFFLTIDNVLPGQEIVAPVSLTFSAAHVRDVLAKKGMRVLSYNWDVTGDGKPDQQIPDPTVTRDFDRTGTYRISVIMNTNTGDVKSASIVFSISRAVFSANPDPAIIEQPVIFSVANIVNNPSDIDSVDWDYDSNGKIDDTTKGPDTTNTFFKLGDVKVTANIKLKNKSVIPVSRTITVKSPDPLPFKVAIVTQPVHLISPPPFSVVFRVDTPYPIADVQWDFGEKQPDTDPMSRVGERVLHQFLGNGNYLVKAKVRLLSGSSATLSTLVRVLDPLALNNLTFDSKDISVNDDKIVGSVPLKLDITPHTDTPFVSFSWEAPDAEVGSTDERLQAVYRKEGQYTLSLLAQDPGNHAMRKNFQVEVDPPKTSVGFLMDHTEGVAPLTVQMDASVSTTLPPNEQITGYEWQCDASAPSKIDAARSNCVYTKEGNYRITLIIHTQDGQTFSAHNDIVVRPPLLTPCMQPSRTTAKVGFAIDFDVSCVLGTWSSMIVDFGDGSDPVTLQPVTSKTSHSYNKPGDFSVTQTLIDPTGKQTKKTFDSIPITP